MSIKPPTGEEVEGAGPDERVGGQLAKAFFEQADAAEASLLAMSIAIAIMRRALVDDCQRVLGADGAKKYLADHEVLFSKTQVHRAPSPELVGVALFRDSDLEDTAEAPLR